VNRVALRWLFGAFMVLGLAGCNNVVVQQQSSGSPPIDKQATWSPPSVVDFPEAPQSLVFSGQLAADVSTAQPTACAWGTGPSGPVYAFSAYFDAGGSSFWFTISTDPKTEPYEGPGTYHPHATLATVGPYGPAQADYEGSVKFVVSHDPLAGRLPEGPKSPNTGTVEGILSDAQGYAVQVSGGWTCVPSMFTGPG
jgi:hypothetical protein